VKKFFKFSPEKGEEQMWNGQPRRLTKPSYFIRIAKALLKFPVQFFLEDKRVKQRHLSLPLAIHGINESEMRLFKLFVDSEP
jgi:hypothetical protein